MSFRPSLAQLCQSLDGPGIHTRWPTITSAATRAASGMTPPQPMRSEEHTSELQSLMRISYAVFCLKKKKQKPVMEVNMKRVRLWKTKNILRITHTLSQTHIYSVRHRRA